MNKQAFVAGMIKQSEKDWKDWLWGGLGAASVMGPVYYLAKSSGPKPGDSPQELERKRKIRTTLPVVLSAVPAIGLASGIMKGRDSISGIW